MDNNIMKKSSESCVEQVYQIRPEHLNGAGRPLWWQTHGMD